MSAFNDYFVDTIKNRYAEFDGRASRSEYWYFMLFSILLFIPLIAAMGFSLTDSIDNPSGLNMSSKILIGFLSVIVIAWTIPSIAVSVRRLHDVGRSGWWYLLRLIGLGIVIFIFSVLESEPGRNKWGPNPWEPDEDDEISQHLIEDFKL